MPSAVDIVDRVCEQLCGIQGRVPFLYSGRTTFDLVVFALRLDRYARRWLFCLQPLAFYVTLTIHLNLQLLFFSSQPNHGSFQLPLLLVPLVLDQGQNPSGVIQVLFRLVLNLCFDVFSDILKFLFVFALIMRNFLTAVFLEILSLDV